jgi:hypothetical protein
MLRSGPVARSQTIVQWAKRIATSQNHLNFRNVSGNIHLERIPAENLSIHFGTGSFNVWKPQAFYSSGSR